MLRTKSIRSSRVHVLKHVAARLPGLDIIIYRHARGLNDGGVWVVGDIVGDINVRQRDPCWFGLHSDTMKCQPRVVRLTGMFVGIYKIYESSVR
jgi:hypothetical protein